MAATFEFKKIAAVGASTSFDDFKRRFNSREIDWLIYKYIQLLPEDARQKNFDGDGSWPNFREFLDKVINLAAQIDSVLKKHDIDFEPNYVVERLLRQFAEQTIDPADVETVRAWIARGEYIRCLLEKELALEGSSYDLWRRARYKIIEELSGHWDLCPWQGDEQQRWRQISEVFRLVPKPKAIKAKIVGNFDVFVSYKRRDNAHYARTIVEHLQWLGYSVWFDEQVIALKVKEIVNKSELAKFIVEAVNSCQIVVVFEAKKEAVAVPPGEEEDHEISFRDTTMDDAGTLIAWNWQKLEIDNARELIGISSDLRVYTKGTSGSSYRYIDEAAVAVGQLVRGMIGSPQRG
ncbi:TIR domain-containing protein [Rhizobium leguminosarum]|uniref:TIR domain-containing protein n=1 Tax=Rhizobium leguminosarum TaxID=384 RepID=UPI001C984868|nr:TIR domain-containing protein [Rhizobium leguminosarum]MBY5353667.1 TIR domain-containing protein [Rhizobium leguminosarum]